MAMNPGLGSFSIMTPQPLGKVLKWLDVSDIYHLSLTSKSVCILVDSALKQVPYVPCKKGIDGLANTAAVFYSWLQNPYCLADLGKKWKVIRNLLAHGEQLDALAFSRSDWVLIEACFNRLTLRIQQLANQWLLSRGVKLLHREPDLSRYRTPKGRTYLMLLASAGQWALLTKYTKPDNPAVFEMSEDGETLLTVLLLKSFKSNEMAIPSIASDIVEWGGKIRRPGDDRALALAAHQGRWNLVDQLLQRKADPCFVTTLPDGTSICPLTSFLQHQRTDTLGSDKAKEFLPQIPELGAKCLTIKNHPFPAHLIDEEPELFVQTLTQCDQNTTYYHPFSYHKEYPIQFLPEAYIEDFPSAVRELVDLGADINAFEEGEESVPFLSRWIKFANEEEKADNANALTTILSDFKPNLNVRDGKGTTPLHFACEKDDPEILKILLENIPPNVRMLELLSKVDHNGFSPAMIATQKKGKKIYDYVCFILGVKDISAYDISCLLLQEGLPTIVHLRTICLLYSRDHKKLLECIKKLEKEFIQSEEAAAVIAEFCPTFAIQPMQELLGAEAWQIWISKVWSSDSVALKWADYYIMHPAESTDWRYLLANLHGTLSFNKQKIAEMLVLGAAYDEEVGRLVQSWLEKFSKMENSLKPLLELYLEEGGKDQEIINLLAKSPTPGQLELVLMDLWESRRYIDSDIYWCLYKRITESGHPQEAAFKRAADLWRLTVDDKDEAKALIEKDDT